MILKLFFRMRKWPSKNIHSRLKKSCEKTSDDQKEADLLEILCDEHAKPIKHISFSGGGAKGALYPGAYSALVESGILESVQSISGASVGSIIAIFTACGSDAKFAYDALVGKDMEDLIGKGSGLLGTGRKATKLYSFISSSIKEILKINIKKFLNPNNESNKKASDIYDKCLDDTSEITFGDLQILNSLEPRVFKQLFITAVEKGTGNPKVFSFEDKDLSITLACRASIALPLILEAVRINDKTYVDGGYYDNLPTPNDVLNDYYIKHNTTVSRSETLLFAFGEGEENTNPLFKALYSNADKLYQPKFKYKILDNILRFAVKSPYMNSERKECEYKKIQKEYPLRTVQLNSYKVTTFDFKAATEQSLQMALEGYFSTINYFANHGLVKEDNRHLILKFFFEVYKEACNTNTLANLQLEILLSYANPFEKTYKLDLHELVEEHIFMCRKIGAAGIVESIVNKPFTPQYIKDVYSYFSYEESTKDIISKDFSSNSETTVINLLGDNEANTGLISEEFN